MNGSGATTEWWAIGWAGWVGVVGVALALPGLYLTWRQARNAAAAADLAASALNSARKQIVDDQLLVLISQLRHVAGQVDAAVLANSHESAVAWLDHWRWSVGHVRGLISSEGADDSLALNQMIQESLGLARAAQTPLLAKKKTVEICCAIVRDSIGQVCDELTTRSGRVSGEVQHNEGVS